MIERQAPALGEADAEEPPRGIEGRPHEIVEDEIRLHLRLVESVARAPRLLGVVTPIPGLDRTVEALGLRQGLQLGRFGGGLALGRLPDLEQQALDRGRVLRHGIVERIGGVIAISQKPRLLGAQRHDLGDQRPIVMRAGLRAAPRPGVEHHAAEIAPRREGQERLDRGAGERNRIAADTALARRLGGGGADEIRQALEITFAERQMPRLLVVQHVLDKERLQRGKPLDDRRQAHLRLRPEQRALAHEIEVMALEQAALIGGEAERLTPRLKVGDAAEQVRIERDGEPVLGELRRVIPRHPLQGVAGVAGVEVEEHLAHASEQPAAALQRLDGIGKAGGFRIPRDRGDVGAVRRHALVEGRREMLDPDAVEGRQAERRRPALEEGIIAHRSSLAEPDARPKVNAGSRRHAPSS